MSLDNFYKLRRDFIVLGLTGKMRSGLDLIVQILTQDKLSEDQLSFLKEFQDTYKGVSFSESRKIRRIVDFYKYQKNWIKFEVLDYRSVVLLFILHQNRDSDNELFAENISNWINELGNYKDFKYPRFGSNHPIAKGSSEFLQSDFRDFLIPNLEVLEIAFKDDSSLFESLKEYDSNFFFSDKYKKFAKAFFEKLDSFSPYLRYRLLHITAYILRRFGTLELEVIKNDQDEDGLVHIYTVADVINRLIKIHRNDKGRDKKTAHVIIDRLKNSYELTYFKEKYSGFYMVGGNAEVELRQQRINSKFSNFKQIKNIDQNKNLTIKLDETEFKVDEFKKGTFEGFDVENCLQKVDYHTYLNRNISFDEITKEYKSVPTKLKNKSLDKTNEFYVYQPFLLQVLKLTALIQQPGLIQPNYVERIMQIAHIAKLNSGCISRQVGAVVTDSHFSVKGIGWNDVPVGQIPCSLRDLRDLDKGETESFSKLELGKTEHRYNDGKSFNENIIADFAQQKGVLDENLKGRSCSFCFKTFHNNYEGKENQVHTRSLHAEENAMLQITKYGGQGLEKGNLFTTASPCELCAKKAFQLGIKNIFFIDLYPGISKNHILEGGKDASSNPNLFQYQGAIGRGYQKLYKPFMSVKDETTLRTQIKPTKNTKVKVQDLTDDKSKQERIFKILNEKI